MSIKIKSCRNCGHLVMAYQTRLIKRFNSDINFFDPADNYRPVMVCPKCNQFLYKTVGLKFDQM